MTVNIFILAATAGMDIGVPNLGWRIIFPDTELTGVSNMHHAI